MNDATLSEVKETRGDKKTFCCCSRPWWYYGTLFDGCDRFVDFFCVPFVLRVVYPNEIKKSSHCLNIWEWKLCVGVGFIKKQNKNDDILRTLRLSFPDRFQVDTYIHTLCSYYTKHILRILKYIMVFFFWDE